MSGVVVAGLLFMAGLNPPPEQMPQKQRVRILSDDAYSATTSGATFDFFRGGITGQYDRTPIQFEQVIGNFYTRLLSCQEPLGVAFEKVLYENLWDLYES